MKKSVLLIGYDSNLCLGVIYCLKEFYNIYLLTSNSKNAAKYSKFLQGIFYYTETSGLSNQIIKLINDNSIDLVMPIDEMEIKFVQQNRQRLSRYAKCTLATDEAMFEIGINKSSLANFLAERNISCPRTLKATRNLSDLKDAADRIGYPLLLKQARSAFGRGVFRFDDWETLHKFYTEHSQAIDEFIIQPFIIGSDVTCNVICENGRVLCHTIQESPVKTGTNFSSNDDLLFHDDEDVIQLVSKMMLELKWNGVACVDMRRDTLTGKVYILEINGRFWASVASSLIKAGVNFPLIMAQLELKNRYAIPTQRPAIQVSLKKYFKEKLQIKNVSFWDTKYPVYFADPFARAAQVLHF